MKELKKFAREQGYKSLPYSKIYELAKDNSDLSWLKEMCGETDGFVYCDENIEFIAYNEQMNKKAQEIVFLHELGHMLLRYPDFRKKGKRTVGETKCEELLADMFACIMMALKTYNACYNQNT